MEESLNSYLFFYQLNYFNSASLNTYMATCDISFIWKNDLCELLPSQTIGYRAHSVPGGREVLLGILGGGVPPGSPNPVVGKMVILRHFF